MGSLFNTCKKFFSNKAEIEELSKKAAIPDLVPTPIVAIDKEFGILYINNAGASVLGSTPEELKGKKCYNLFKTAHCNTSECRCAQAMQQDGTFTGETIADPTGLNLPIMYTGAPLKDFDGNITGAIEFVLNTTDIKKVQKNIEKVSHFQKNEVDKLSETLDVMSSGDLTVSYSVNDADSDTEEVHGAFTGIQKALGSTLKSINSILNQVNVSIDQMATGAEQVSDSSQALSQGATEQASSLEEVSATINEISGRTKQNAENSNEANNLSENAKQAADNGNEQMNEMLGAMAEINKSSSEISKIIKVIDEIAFQTNLLALNAAVEAARAGVHGKGFAIVAEEVRNLAQRSAQAAKETTDLIEGSVKKVVNGTRIANSTAGALTEIVDSVSKVTHLISDIAKASDEQSQSIEMVTQALGQIDNVTQANTANAEESAAASEELSSQSEGLKNLIRRFRLKKEDSYRVDSHKIRSTKKLSKPDYGTIKSSYNSISVLNEDSLIEF